MKRAVIWFLLMYVALASADEEKTSLPKTQIIHVATAIDHLTVLEFGEPVRIAAAGSPAFQIERHEDKVFIKPLKPGASTNLFVWTASRRFNYELEPAGEVKNMDFSVDNSEVSPKPAPDTSSQLADLADLTTIRTFLGAELIRADKFIPARGTLTLRIQHVLQSDNALYIHYSISNHSSQPYRVTAPRVTEIAASQPTVSVQSLRQTQLSAQVFRKLGHTTERQLTVTKLENQKNDLSPDQDTEGVVEIREQLSSPAIVRLIFGLEGPHQLQAVVAF
ncbi:MAG: TrbG/VirB9 family P-type conjugative transfer protein [Acidobacteria bacterium]|nr:TrbG/VirB9 family P-type conjugative transfer protein [Acidobacteriota bacterium]MBV9436865.1 TrbG/VirB9 family P-type conjugative transfer protein [Acidobacteriota bacterium]